MTLPDGTSADVTALENVDGKVTATVHVVWPGGTATDVSVICTPQLNVQAGPMSAIFAGTLAGK